MELYFQVLSIGLVTGLGLGCVVAVIHAGIYFVQSLFKKF